MIKHVAYGFFSFLEHLGWDKYKKGPFNIVKIKIKFSNKNDSQNIARNQNNIVLAALFRGLFWEGDKKRERVSKIFGDKLVKQNENSIFFTLSGLENTYSQSME